MIHNKSRACHYQNLKRDLKLSISIQDYISGFRGFIVF